MRGVLAFLGGPRLIVSALIAFTVGGQAWADQTDPRLDELFRTLRTGEAADADATVASIHAIWTDSDSDTVSLLVSRVAASIDAEQYAVAQSLLDHIVGLSPSFAQGFALRGSVRLRADDKPGAIEDFTRTLDLEPRHFESRIALAELYLESGDKEAAYAEFQRALEWNPHEQHARDRARQLRRELDGREI